MYKIEDIEFHDLSLDKLTISFENKEIILSISIYNQNSCDYDNNKLIYSDVSKVNFTGQFGDIDYSTEINDLIKTKKNGIIEYVFKIIGGKGMFYTELTFEAVKETLIPAK